VLCFAALDTVTASSVDNRDVELLVIERPQRDERPAAVSSHLS
jgi:hypothetical protein